MPKVTLIGAGNMGAALLGGWLESGVLAAAEVVVCEKDESRREETGRLYGVMQEPRVPAAVDGAEYVVLAIKPQDSAQVMETVAPSVHEGQAVISIVAGLSLATIRERLGGGPSLVRVMPNIAAKVRAAMSGYSIDAGTRGLDRKIVEGLLGAVGEAIEVDEQWLDLVTALSGSGPAYYYYLAEALEEAGVECGMDPEVARKLARGTFWGAAKLLNQTGEEAGNLRQAVSSPGGTTVAGIGELEKAGFKKAVAAAVVAARNRARELTS